MVFRDFVDSADRSEAVREIDSAGEPFFRQYKCGNVPEPRLHVLLAQQPSLYRYHGVTMAAKTLKGKLEQIAAKSSRYFEGRSWNVGVDVVCYRDGNDSCGWHADDTQGETLVFCVVLQSQGGPRRVRFRPKFASASPKRKRRRLSCLQRGDEELELWLDEGDAYSMDGEVQVGYEHSVPKVAEEAGRRIVAIMRAGKLFRSSDEKCQDTGEAAKSLVPPGKRLLAFGALDCDSTTVYSRETLMATRFHSSPQKGVSGSAILGAASIVVSRQSSQLREADGLLWLRYTSTRRQGAVALWRSLRDDKPVRVFRSSSLLSRWAPRKVDSACQDDNSPSSTNAAVYRYDGLYRVVAMWDSAGAPSAVEPAQPMADDFYELAYTFRLVRCDGPPNARRNAEFASALSNGICWPTPPVDSAVTLPPINKNENFCRRELFLLERRTIAASILLDVVSLVVAHQSGWFHPAVVPQLDHFERWHAHRKLYWRFERHTRKICSLLPSQRIFTASETSCCDAMLETKTKDETLRDMLAAATARSLTRDVSSRRRRERDADEVVADDDPRLSSLCLENICGLCGWGEVDDEDTLVTFSNSSLDRMVRVHESCALTSSEVYCNGDGGYVDVVSAVKRGKLIKCSLDKKCLAKRRSGATVGCGNARCRKSYHCKCAIASGWQFFAPNFRFWCEAHREQPANDASVGSWFFDCERCGVKGHNFDDGEDMWQCSQCETWQHARCAAAVPQQPERREGMEDDYKCSRCRPIRPGY